MAARVDYGVMHLGGGITTWAEEPEEVEVQIEAQTDGEIEAENDAQIEADTEEETGVDAEIGAETGNEATDGQDGEEQNVKTPDEGEQVEKAVSLTGLVAYDEFNRNEAGEITGRDDCTPKKKLEMDTNGGTLYLADRKKDGENVTETAYSFYSLIVMRYDSGESRWKPVLRTGEQQSGGITEYGYDLSVSTEVDKQEVTDWSNYNKISFYRTGEFRIYKKDGFDYGNMDNIDHIEITVTPVPIGFYQGKTSSGKYLDGQYKYKEGGAIFSLIRDTEKVELVGDGITLDEGNFSEEEWKAMVEPGTGNVAYIITIPETCQEDFSVSVQAKVKKNGAVEDKKVSLKLSCNCEGLNAIRPERNPDDTPLAFGQTAKNEGRLITIDLGREEHLYFYTYVVAVDEGGRIDKGQMTSNSLKLYYFDNDSAEKPSFVEATGEEYGTIQICEESGCAGKNIFSFDLKKEGIYKVEDISSSFYDGSRKVIIKTQCPKYGFYTADTVSAENLVWDGADYCYGSEDNDDYNRTLYFLKRDGAEGTITDVRAIWRGKDKTKEFITPEPVANGREITINPACQQDFELQVYIDGEEKPQTIPIQYYERTEPNSSRNDGQREKAFSGCMLTQQGYQIGSYDGRNCQPADQYWAYGNSVQEVLNELADIETIPNTGYYYITMSCYTGNTDAEENQEKEQTVTLPESVKGIVMASGQEPEKAWGSTNPNFDQDDCWDVYDIDDIYACYLEFGNEEEGTSSLEDGWYQVAEEESEEGSGIYIYDRDNLLDSVDVPRPGSEEWNKLSDVYQTVKKYFYWPNLVLDATDGHVPVKLEGQWAEQAGVKINYSDKKNTEFEVEICGRKITKENVADSVTVKATNNADIMVSFNFVPCEHEGETEVKDAKAATCTENGYTGDIYCADCDTKRETGTATPAIGHKWDAGKVTKPATETEKGVKTYTCQNDCGETKTEEIPALGTKPGQPQPQPEQPQPQPEQPQPQPKGTKIADPAGNTYKVTSDSQAKEPTVEYTAPKKDAKGTVKVPDSVTVDGVVYKVTAIADNAFKGNKKVTKVTIGKNVISIGKNTFSGCAKLKNVTIGAGVMEIGDSAFKGCAALTKITLSAKVQKIGKNAFVGCKKLKLIIIKSTKLTAKSVSKGAFKGLTAKTTIKVPKNKVKAYKKLFQAKGLSKKIKVKKA